jgi:hypothetical protein
VYEETVAIGFEGWKNIPMACLKMLVDLLKWEYAGGKR